MIIIENTAHASHYATNIGILFHKTEPIHSNGTSTNTDQHISIMGIRPHFQHYSIQQQTVLIYLVTIRDSSNMTEKQNWQETDLSELRHSKTL